MAFTATINNVQLVNERIHVTVTYVDSATGFTTTKSLEFPQNINENAFENKITADGNTMKNDISRLNTLQGKVGTVITI